MMDYRVTVSVRNNRILELGEQIGLNSAAAIAKASGVPPTIVGEYVNLKVAPINSRGDWRPTALRLAEALACEPDDLWSDEQKTMELDTNKAHRNVSSAQLQELACCPEQAYLEDQTVSVVRAAIGALPERMATILSMRYGLDPFYREHTLEEIGDAIGITRERVRQIEAKAKRLLRHPEASVAMLSTIDADRECQFDVGTRIKQ